MKFNFRKIASVLAGAVMLSSTVAIAAAANFPAPFVSNGAGNYAVVYGSAAPTTSGDNVAALDISTFLTGKVTTPPATVVPNPTPTEGDFVQLQTNYNKFNLGDKATDVQTTALDSSDLPSVLADGTYTNGDGNDFDYKQKLNLGPLTLGYNKDSRFNNNNPFIGIVAPNGQNIMNYTLTFSSYAEGNDDTFAGLTNTVINILGRDYYISNAANTTNGVKLTLLDTANSVRVNEGDTQTLSVGNSTVKVQVVSVNSGTPNTVTLAVNDVELSNDLSAGHTTKIRGTDMYVGVKKINAKTQQGAIQSAVITVGTGQLVLENGLEIQLNGKTLSSLTQYDGWKVNSYIDTSGTSIKAIKLEWLANKKVALMSGDSWVMPGFEGVKLSMGDFVTPTAEETTVEDSSDSAQVRTTIKDGDLQDFSMFFSNTTTIKGLGADDTDVLVTNATDGTVPVSVNLNTENGTYFAATWINGKDAESYVYKLSDVNGINSNTDNETVLTNMVTNDDVKLEGIGDEQTVGTITFKSVAADRADGTATVEVSAATTGKLYTDKIATKGGMVFELPTDSIIGDSSYTSTFYEADKDGNLPFGSSANDNSHNFTVTMNPSSDGTQPTDVSIPTWDQTKNSDTKVGYLISDLATQVLFDNPSSGAKSLKIEYHPTESYGQVYVTESKVQLSEGGSSGGAAGSLVVTDSEVSGVQSKNLIVVGGSCVNTVAAQLLGSSTPLCGADWTAKTNAGSGAFLIQTFANPWSSGQVATLVAGYDATDTTNAANALKTETIDTTVGKKYVKLAGSTLQLV